MKEVDKLVLYTSAIEEKVRKKKVNNTFMPTKELVRTVSDMKLIRRKNEDSRYLYNR